jgi:hypothetical protein
MEATIFLQPHGRTDGGRQVPIHLPDVLDVSAMRQVALRGYQLAGGAGALDLSGRISFMAADGEPGEATREPRRGTLVLNALPQACRIGPVVLSREALEFLGESVAPVPEKAAPPVIDAAGVALIVAVLAARVAGVAVDVMTEGDATVVRVTCGDQVLVSKPFTCRDSLGPAVAVCQ